MITFYTNKSGGPIVQKILFMLIETGISYTTVEIDMNNDTDGVNNLSNINPNKTVPIIKDSDNGAVVFESDAILLYLAEKTELLLPKEQLERVDVMKWLIFEAANFGAVMGELYYYLLKSPGVLSTVHIDRYKEKIALYCRMLDSQLIDRNYICNQFSIADITYYPWFVILEDLTDVSIDNYPNLKMWLKTIGKRSSQLTN